jgi:endoglucanase
MDYNITVPSSGSFSVNLRVASPSGGQLQIKNSAGSVLATVAIPATGGWQNWQTISTSITLPQGAQTIRVYSASNGWNFNWMDIIGGTTSTPPPSSTTTRIEAETYAAMSGVVKEATTDAGGGQSIGYIDTGDWMDYNINVSSSGSYAVNLRVASPLGGQLQIKNSVGTILATVTVPNTGDWQAWQTVSTNITLAAGTQTIRIYSASNGWNFNWFELASGSGTVSAASASKVQTGSAMVSLSDEPMNVYPNPFVTSFQLQISNEFTGSVSVELYNASGILQKQFALSKPDKGRVQYYLSLGQVPAGNYIIKVVMDGWMKSEKIIKQ